MTREEAKAILIDKVKPCLNGTDWEYALDMAIKALGQEPRDDATLQDIFCMGCEYKEQEPCEDAIDRKYLTGLMFTETDLSDAHACYESIRRIVKEMPSVTPIRPRGHWVYIRNERKRGGYIEVYTLCKCSECGMEQDSYSSQFINFCPNCGADMREEQKNDA